MVERVSPLAEALSPRVFGLVGEAGPGLRLSTRTDLSLWQVAAWPQTAGAVSAALAEAVGAAAPGFGRVAEGPGGTLLRLSPLKWWIIDGARPGFDAETAVTLDLSHEQTPVRVEGRDAEALMARVAAVDFRAAAFPPGSFAATGGHHLMLKVRRLGPEAFEIYVMRSLAQHLWETLEALARPFGAETV